MVYHRGVKYLYNDAPALCGGDDLMMKTLFDFAYPNVWTAMTQCDLPIVLYGMVLAALGGSLPYVDSMSTVVSVVAQILSIWRLMEQWVLWIVVDIVTVVMWAVDFAKGGETIATLAMWSIYLINAFIMFARWYREAKRNEKEEQNV